MKTDNDAGEALEGVARIRPVVDRLRRLLKLATILDLKATRRAYWADQPDEPGPVLSAERAF